MVGIWAGMTANDREVQGLADEDAAAAGSARPKLVDCDGRLTRHRAALEAGPTRRWSPGGSLRCRVSGWEPSGHPPIADAQRVLVEAVYSGSCRRGI